MLREISVKNLAIIEDIQIDFKAGLNVLSGETGAGKSILVGAIGLVMGNRASSEMIRSGTKSAEVQALFAIKDISDVVQFLKERDIEGTDELIVRRVISQSGNNRIYLNGSLVPLGVLKELGESLINVYGQHESQGLQRPETHLDILDAYGGLTPDRETLAGQYEVCKEKLKRIEELKKREAERASREDYLRFKINEIEKVGLKPGEMEYLESRRKRLKGADQLAQAVNTVLDAVYDSEGSILGRTGELARHMTKAEAIDQALETAAEHLEQISIAGQELADFCRNYLAQLEHDPKVLEEIEDRIHLIRGMIKKYGQDEETILNSLQQAKDELSEMENLTHLLKEAEKEAKEALMKLKAMAESLEKKRRKTSLAMSKEIVRELADLGMKGANFSPEVEPLPGGGILAENLRIDETGCNRVEFLLSANPGEPLRPLAKVASGGELSRILLAIKNGLAKHFYVPTLVFDEVDAGIGGRQAETVGRKLKEVAKQHQVLCITHLPQIASKASEHFVVKKQVVKGRTITAVNQLDEDARIEETARMLSGEKITEATRAAARELLRAE